MHDAPGAGAGVLDLRSTIEGEWRRTLEITEPEFELGVPFPGTYQLTVKLYEDRRRLGVGELVLECPDAMESFHEVEIDWRE